jgi:putative GTP pyrophosphokinase
LEEINLELNGKIAEEHKNWFTENNEPTNELMAYYRCAMMEVETKFRVLREELSLKFDRNPIEEIKSRLKSRESISGKLAKKGYPLTLENIERYLDDVAGIRIICTFPSDIYQLADSLLMQDDVILIEKKDYIKDPKANGYRSLHLIIAVPIFLHDHKKLMTVEVQFRTTAMNWWASLEHKIMYKRNHPDMPKIEKALLQCAQDSYSLDLELENIYKAAIGESDNTKPLFSDSKMQKKDINNG